MEPGRAGGRTQDGPNGRPECLDSNSDGRRAGGAIPDSILWRSDRSRANHLGEVDLLAMDAGTAIGQTAHAAWPPGAIGFCVIDREGRAVFGRQGDERSGDHREWRGINS